MKSPKQHPPTHQTKHQPTKTSRGHLREGYGLSWSPHTEGRLLSGSDDGRVCMWDLGGGKKGRVVEDGVIYRVLFFFLRFVMWCGGWVVWSLGLWGWDRPTTVDRSTLVQRACSLSYSYLPSYKPKPNIHVRHTRTWWRTWPGTGCTRTSSAPSRTTRWVKWVGGEGANGQAGNKAVRGVVRQSPKTPTPTLKQHQPQQQR